ncbi:hypothetical protein LTR85_004939 [Meristemomyces frigidus]|nr:hypothetical protein LTR85_004939 [Meristemomyces frigidus]
MRNSSGAPGPDMYKNAEQSGASAKSKAKKTPAATGSTSADMKAMTNLFSQLEVEEPSAAPLGAQPKTQLPKNAAKVQEYDLADEEDNAFALWCFLEDLNDVRTFVRNTWHEFAAGDISFVAASMVTDVAFGLMRSADEDFVKERPLFADHMVIMLYLGLGMTILGHHVHMFPLLENLAPRELKPGIDVADLLCPAAAMLLRGYTKKLRSCSGHTSNAKQDRSPGSEADPFEKYSFHEFGPVLLERVPRTGCIVALAMGKPNLTDEFIRGMDRFRKTAAMRMWLVVACQTYMDICDVIGSNAGVGLDSLRKWCQDSEDAVRRWDSQLKHFGIDAPVHARLRRLASDNGDLARVAGMTTPDPSLQPGAHVSKASPDPVLSTLPVYSGHLLYGTTVRLHCESLPAANSGMVVLAMAHLYNAMRHYVLLDLAWHDMDFVISQQSTNRPLVTKTAANADPKALARHYQMALGVPATSFARNPSLTLPQNLLTGKKFVSNARCIGEGDKVRGMERDNNSYETVLQAMTATNEAKDKVMKTAVKFTPLQLLATFKKSMVVDEPHINFDYLNFWADCQQLLLDMTRVLRKLPSELSGGVDHGFKLVYALLRDAANVQLRLGSLAGAAIGDAAAVLRDFIADNSKKYTQPAYDQSSGRIPRAFRPTFEPRTSCCDISAGLLKEANETRGWGVKFGSSRRIIAVYEPKATYRMLVAHEKHRLQYEQWIRDKCPMDNIPLYVEVLRACIKDGDKDCLKSLEMMRSMHEDMNKMDDAGVVRKCAMDTYKLRPGERQMIAKELKAEREMTLRALME